jgi:hypothetical protein
MPSHFLQRVELMIAAAALALAASRGLGAAVDFEPSWRAPAYNAVREDVLRWLDDADLPADKTGEVERLWPAEAPAAANLLDRLAESFALAQPSAAELVRRCQAAYEGPAAPSAEWLGEPDLPPLVRNNLRLYYARWLAQFGLYDEVLDQIGDLRPADVVDPQSLLFYQMAAHHQLVQPDEARAALAQLLEHEDQLPRRYQQVAQLLERDLASLEDESLDHIARRMRDIRRRLDYGRAGAKVQKIEQGVVDSLDKKIEDLEKQQQQQQQSASSGSGSQQSSRPMEESRPAELKAPMQVDRRDIGHSTGWGDLPPKQREQAMQQIGREFPAHYRELIEEYFRELANEAPPPAGSPAADGAR